MVATAPDDELSLVPLSDGGPGFLDVLQRSLGTETEVVAVTVSDPLGRDVPAAVLLTDRGGVRTAFVESAQAAGLHLLEADERNPALTSTWGVGQLLDAAVGEGAQRVVVGLGGSGTNDGGAGLLAALGAGPADVLARGGLALAAVDEADLVGLAQVRLRLAGVDIVVATDVDNPLLGLDGASAVYGPQKGASPELAQELEWALGRFADVARASPARRRTCSPAWPGASTASRVPEPPVASASGCSCSAGAG